MAGVGRYTKLEIELKKAAAQSRTLFAFWGNLSRHMLWNAPERAQDDRVLALLQDSEPIPILRILATIPSSVVMLARSLHTEDKALKKAIKEGAVFDKMGDSLEGKLL